MYYMVGRPHKHDYRSAMIRILLIALGLLIGASLGLYIAAKTLPLPDTTTNNFYKTP